MEITQYAVDDGYLYVQTAATNFRLIRPRILRTTYEPASQIAIDYIALIFSVLFGFTGILAATSAATMGYAIIGFGLPLFLACQISKCRADYMIRYVEFSAMDCDRMFEDIFYMTGQRAADLLDDIHSIRKDPPMQPTAQKYSEYFE